MGGIFNIVNLHVYHYAGNNPVVMIDPDGREGLMAGDALKPFINHADQSRPFTPYESAFIYKILGVSTVGFETRIKSGNNPNGVSGSFVNGTIIFDNKDLPTMASSENKGIMVHEFFHQYQYKKNLFGATLGLALEALRNKILGPLFEGGRQDEGYRFGDYTNANALLNVYQTLDDLPNYESRAMLVGQFAELYDRLIMEGSSKLNDIQKNALKQQARILYNSGFRSEAIDHINKITW
jgi:hypothetical protein